MFEIGKICYTSTRDKLGGECINEFFEHEINIKSQVLGKL